MRLPLAAHALARARFHVCDNLRTSGEGRLEYHPGGLRHTRLNQSLLFIAHLRFHLA